MDRKRKRHSNVELEWTAARCQRLLRPVASRILPLRRLSYITGSQIHADANTTPVVRSRASEIHGAEAKESGSSLHDPAWFPNHERKPRLKKYSSRSRFSQPGVKQAPSPQACLVALPTPFKARALRRGTPIKQNCVGFGSSDSPTISKKQPPARTKRHKKDPFTRAPLAKQSAELQNRQNFEKIFELHQGVSDGFNLLLQKTSLSSEQPSAHKGAPTLLKMCLNRIPDYIQAEEGWRKSVDEDDDTDVSAEVYEELESLGTVSGRGWPGLRDVVVAHGVKLVREIIQEKLVSMNTRAELAMMPLRYNLKTEAEQLSLAYAHSLPLKRPLNTESPLFDGCLSGLRDIGSGGTDSDRKNVHVRILNDLFHSNKLRSSWLASRDMVKFSSEMIRALASHSGETMDVIDFLRGRISQVAEAELSAPDQPLERPGHNRSSWLQLETSMGNTIVSIITVLTAIVLIQRSSEEGDQARRDFLPAQTLLFNIAIDVLRNLGENGAQRATNGTADDRRQQRRVCFTVLASTLILCIDRKTSGKNLVCLRKEDILHGMSKIHEHYAADQNCTQTMIERAAIFVCELSRCCGQSLNSSSQEYLETLVQSIVSDAQHGSSLENTLLKQLALESSLYFAKISVTQQSRTFMETIENMTLQQGPLHFQYPVAKSVQACSFSRQKRLRWEEGLCEWIAATPLPATKIRTATREAASGGVPLSDLDEESEIEDSGYLSGIQETPAPRSKPTSIFQLLASPDVLGIELNFSPRSDSPEGPISTKHSSKARASTKRASTLFEENDESRKTSLCLDLQVQVPKKILPDPKEDKSCSADSSSKTDTVGRSKKKRKVRSTEHSGSSSSESQQPTFIPPQPLAQGLCFQKASNSETTTTVGNVHDEEDELAMSCKKPQPSRQHLRASQFHGTAQAQKKLAANLSSRIKPRESDLLDDSGDELGF